MFVLEIQSIHPDNITIVVFRALWSNELKVEVSLKVNCEILNFLYIKAKNFSLLTLIDNYY